MKYLLYQILSALLLLMPVSSVPVRAQTPEDGFEISGGVSMFMYQSVYSTGTGTAVETALGRHLAGVWDWQAGARLGFDPTAPDVFLRLMAAPLQNVWRPSVGIELGITNRGRFSGGDRLLAESRRAMEDDISHVYIAAHSTPLSFRVRDRWRFSVLEFHIGTHLGHTGRTLRVQVGLLSIGRSL